LRERGYGRIVNVAWIGSPACSFTFDLTGGRATY
jgi:hypothetical protein